jgi:hypothetical protein
MGLALTQVSSSKVRSDETFLPVPISVGVEGTVAETPKDVLVFVDDDSGREFVIWSEDGASKSAVSDGAGNWTPWRLDRQSAKYSSSRAARSSSDVGAWGRGYEGLCHLFRKSSHSPQERSDFPPSGNRLGSVEAVLESIPIALWSAWRHSAVHSTAAVLHRR